MALSAPERLQSSAINYVIKCVQSKHFALGCLKKFSHILAPHTESAPVYASDDPKTNLTLGRLHLLHAHGSQQIDLG